MSMAEQRIESIPQARALTIGPSFSSLDSDEIEQLSNLQVAQQLHVQPSGDGFMLLPGRQQVILQQTAAVGLRPQLLQRESLHLEFLHVVVPGGLTQDQGPVVQTHRKESQLSIYYISI
ncbi:unnamed protein product [Lepidochelys kempii]